MKTRNKTDQLPCPFLKRVKPPQKYPQEVFQKKTLVYIRDDNSMCVTASEDLPVGCDSVGSEVDDSDPE